MSAGFWRTSSARRSLLSEAAETEETEETAARAAKTVAKRILIVVE
jgi:hypothetical protein